MKLWIRSQDRESIFKVKSIFYSTNNENEHFVRSIIVDDIKNGIMTLGEYATKERALEVLDEIQGKITQNECLKTMMSKVTDIRGHEEMFGKLFKETIYEMPEE